MGLPAPELEVTLETLLDRFLDILIYSFQYLRNVLLEFLTGGRDRKVCQTLSKWLIYLLSNSLVVTQNLVKVIVAVCRFSDEQARKVLSRAV